MDQLGIVWPPTWLELARVGSSWLEFDQTQIFAQLEPCFPPFGQLSPSCFVIVMWLDSRIQTIERFLRAGSTWRCRLGTHRCKFWFCNLAWVGSTVWPGLNMFSFCTRRGWVVVVPARPPRRDWEKLLTQVGFELATPVQCSANWATWLDGVFVEMEIWHWSLFSSLGYLLIQSTMPGHQKVCSIVKGQHSHCPYRGVQLAPVGHRELLPVTLQFLCTMWSCNRLDWRKKQCHKSACVFDTTSFMGMVVVIL